MKVTFPLLDRVVEVQEGSLVSDVCTLVGAPLDMVCGGNGTCDKCRVDVMENGRRRNVLGCRHAVSEGMEILAEGDSKGSKYLETAAEDGLDFSPRLRNVLIPTAKLATPMGSYDFSRLASVLKEDGGITVDVPDYSVILLLEEVYRAEGGKFLNVVMSGRRIIDLVRSESRIPLYAVAVDVGTTSVVAFLYNMATGRLLGHCSDLNSQSVFGADVISRIEHASSSTDSLRAEQEAIAATVDGLVRQLCSRYDVDTSSIYEIVYCGNSTMQHLFLGLNPGPLGRIPFTGVVSQEVSVPATELPISMNPRGLHVFMPLLGGYVGADTTACLLELPMDSRMRMMIDMGTNCEVTLGIDARVMVASTACGPALEGAGISMGMRADAGAVESVSWQDGAFSIGTVGDAPPVGFCGSGIIDMVAVLVQEGALNSKGAFLKGSKLEAHPWKDRILQGEDGKRFVLLSAEENPAGIEISISQKDIRAVQLAKSAICTGCEILTSSYGISMEDIEEICLAGAFGNYMDIPNAQDIGIIPRIDGVPVKSIGNGAGLGVQRYLLSERERRRAEEIRKSASHVELADDPAFADAYVRHMKFGETSRKQ